MKKLNGRIDQNLTKTVPKMPLWRKILSRISFAALVPLISFTILFAVLFDITEEKKAKETLTLIIASAFSQKGLDDETEIIEIRKKMDNAGVAIFAPIDGMNIEITKRDIEELSPRDLRLKIFSRISDILYSQDKNEIEKLVTNNEIKNSLENTGFLGIISKNGHKETEKWFFYSLLASCSIGALVYSLSKGLNRVKAPAKAVVFASFPMLVITYMVKLFLGSPSQVSMTGDAQDSLIVMNIVKNALPQIIDTFIMVYSWVFIVSASVYVGITIYKFWNRLFKQNNNCNA